MIKKIRAAVIIPKYGLIGGAEQFARELSIRIADTPDCEIHVFANKWQESDDRIIFHKVPIITFPKFLTSISFAWFSQLAIKRHGGFDLVHTHDRVFQADLATLHGTPHRFWTREVRRKRMSLFDLGTDFVERSFIEGGGFFRLMAVSGLVKNTLMKEYPSLDCGKISIIHPGVDNATFDRLTRALCQAEIREQYRIGKTDILVLFVSMNFELKGLDLLLKSLARANCTLSESKFKLLVVGKGNIRKYGRMAEELGIRNAVVFTGPLEPDALKRIYVASDIFSMLSKFDTFGMSALEAMAAGVPVLISNRVGARDLVVDGLNGFIIEFDSDPSLAAVKLLHFADPGQRAFMSENALRTAQANSWQATAGKVEGIYREFLEFSIAQRTRNEYLQKTA